MSQVRNLTASGNLRGITYMVLAGSLFVINDSFIKALMTAFDGSLAMPLGQAMFMRGLFALPLVFAATYFMKAWRPVSTIFQPLFLLRLASEFFMIVCFLTALANLPLATLTAIMQAIPLVVTLAAYFIFGEQLGWRRMVAILVGFFGVLVIVRPGFEGFSYFALFAVAAVLSSTVRDLVTRRLPDDVPGMFVTCITMIWSMLVGLGFVLGTGAWVPVGEREVWWLIGSAVGMSCAQYCIIMAMRFGEIDVVSPFRYVPLLLAVVFGFVFFSERPDFFTLIGAAIIVASGLYTLHRERLAAKERAKVAKAQ